jgi:hypothetical protein
MDVLPPSPHSAERQIGALATIARAATNGFSRPQRALLKAFQEVVFATAFDVDALDDVDAQSLADQVDVPAQGRQLVRFMVVLALTDGPPSRAQMEWLRAYARALHVDEPAVNVIDHLARGHRLRFRIAFMRRSHMRHYMKNTYRMAGGIFSVIRAVLRFRGVLPEDVEKANRFRALEKLPGDSLGHHFFAHCRKNALPFPGEQGGFPDGAVYHDFTHVLTGYDTSPQGEMKNAAFQAGYTKDDHDFFTWLISIVLHTTGVNLTPFEMEMEPGRIGEEGLAAEILRELKRGTQMKVDLGERWSCWDYVELPIDVARERLGVVRAEVEAG